MLGVKAIAHMFRIITNCIEMGSHVCSAHCFISEEAALAAMFGSSGAVSC